MIWTIPVVTWSKVRVCGHSLAGTASLNPADGINVSVYSESSGRGPCDGLIASPEKSYRMLCV